MEKRRLSTREKIRASRHGEYRLEKGNALWLAEKKYATAEIIEFSKFTSCIGVVGRKGKELTGMHLVLPPEDTTEAEIMSVLKQINGILEGSQEVIIVGCSGIWNAQGGQLYWGVKEPKLLFSTTSVNRPASIVTEDKEDGYYTVGPCQEDQQLNDCWRKIKETKVHEYVARKREEVERERANQ